MRLLLWISRSKRKSRHRLHPSLNLIKRSYSHNALGILFTIFQSFLTPNRLDFVDVLLLALFDGVHIASEPTSQRPPRLANNTCDAASAAEHHLEFLKRAAHSLGVEEEDDGHNNGRDDEEDEVVLPADCLNSNRSDHVDDEVPQPVVGGRDTGHGDTEAGGCDLSAVQEVGAEETNGDEKVEEEDEERGDDLSWLVALRVRRGNGKSQHARGHTGAGEHEELAATEAVDGEEGDEAGQELPGKRTTRQNAGSLRVEAKTLLEDDGGVGGDQVGTTHLLEELQEDAEREAVEQLVLAVCEDVADLDGAALGLLESELDAANLRGNLRVVEVKTLELRQTLPGLLNTALVDQPTRRFRDREDGYHGDERDDGGNRKGNAPLKRKVVLLEETEVDPGLEEVTEGDKAPVKHNVLTTVGGRRALRLPYRNGSTELTNTPSKDKTTDDELRKPEGSALEDLTNESKDSANEDDFAATQPVTDPRAGKSTEEGTNGEGRNNSTLLG